MTELNRATIMGTGTMGPGMGAVLARAGLQVTLFDVAPEALERARGMVDVVRGVLDRLEVPDQGGTVSLQSDRDAALDDAEIVVEAVPERPTSSVAVRRGRGADRARRDHRVEHARGSR